MNFLPPPIQNAIERMRVLGPDAQHYEVISAGDGLPDSLLETISAFANRDGGTLILGLDVKSMAAVPGFDAKKIHYALLRLGRDLTPPCRLNIERYPVEGGDIVVASIQPVPLNQRPCYITKKGLRFGSFIRTKDGNKRLTDYEIERLREFSKQPAFDREPVEEATLDDLNPEILDAIVQRNREIAPRVFGKMPRDEALVRLGALAPAAGGKYVPTLAGLLAAGIFPQQFFPRLNITFTVYPGVTKAQAEELPGRYSVTQPINGSIPEMLTSAIELLRQHMGTGALIQGALRREVTDYPIPACREAIVNALQHRDYSPDGRGSQVQINLYADRLEILNPGGLYGAASFSSLPHGISATRNTRLSQLLEFTPYKEDDGQTSFVIENRGSGLQQIKQELHEDLLPEADLKDFVSAFQITFFKRQFPETEKTGNIWKNFDAALLAALEKQGSMSVNEIIDSSGLSRNTVSSHIRSLKNRGLIEGTERPKSPRQRYRLVKK